MDILGDLSAGIHDDRCSDNEASYLMMFISQLFIYRPTKDEKRYTTTLIESLIQFFKVPKNIIAAYLGMEEAKLDLFLSDFDNLPADEKYPVMLEIKHLFECFVRNPEFSVPGYFKNSK